MSQPPLPPQGSSPAGDSIFRVGNPELTREVLEGDRRLLHWQMNGQEHQFAPYARWATFPHGHDEQTHAAYLEIPIGTRSASSVLAGAEAWPGEKLEIVDFLVSYVSATAQDMGGGIDGNLSLDTIAVTKDRKLLATPPHELVVSRRGVGVVLNGLLADLQRITVTDARQKELVYRALSGFRALHTAPGQQS